MNVSKKRLEILSKIGSTDMQELVAYLIENDKLVTDLEHDIDQYREIDKQHLERIAELEDELREYGTANIYLRERIAELDTENKRLKNRGTITSPMDGLFEENERLEAKLDAAEATIKRVKGLSKHPVLPGGPKIWVYGPDLIKALKGEERRSE